MHPDGHPTKYAATGDFTRALRARVDAHFKGRSRIGDPRVQLKAAVILAWWGLSYLAAVFVATTWWSAALSVLSLALASAAVPTCIGHDGAHAAFSERSWLNSCAAWSINILGLSTPWWRVKHGTLHHAHTRVNGIDDDLEQGLLFRMHPEQVRRPWHRWQHLYSLTLYPFLHLSMMVTGLRFLFSGKVGNHSFRRPPLREQLTGLGLTSLGALLLFILPCLVREPWMVALGLLAWSAMFGLVLVLIFQAEHCVGELESPRRSPETGRVELDWATSQVLATQGFAHGNRALTWYSGALNLHVEHHLFPRMSHTHYQDLTGIVAQVCAEHGIPYRVVPTFREAVAAHFRWLKVLGRAEEQPTRATLPEAGPLSSAASLPSGA